jgi:hypothetical protein
MVQTQQKQGEDRVTRIELQTHLLSEALTSSTASHARRASGELAPNFLEISSASLIKLLESTRLAKRIVWNLWLPETAGENASEAATRRQVTAKESFIFGLACSDVSSIGSQCFLLQKEIS